jgi:hypothetical protein
MEYWTPNEIRRLEEEYPHKPNDELTKSLNKSEIAIVSKAQRMKLKKDWRFRQQVLKDAKLKQ